MKLLELAIKRGLYEPYCEHEYKTMCRWERKDGQAFAAYQCDDCGQMLEADTGPWRDISELPPMDKVRYKERMDDVTRRLFG